MDSPHCATNITEYCIRLMFRNYDELVYNAISRNLCKGIKCHFYRLILLILFLSDAFQIRARCILPCFFFQISYYLSSIRFKRFRNYNWRSMELFHSSCRVSVIKVSVTVNTKISSLWHQNKTKTEWKNSTQSCTHVLWNEKKNCFI